MPLFEIPISPATPQSFLIALPTGQYRFLLQWRETGAQCWLMDLQDEYGNVLVAGVPLVTGGSLLGQYPAIDLGGDLLVVSDGTPDAQPTFANLGDAAHLYFSVP